MGKFKYGQDHNGHMLTGFVPDNTETELYVRMDRYSDDGMSLGEILTQCYEKWPESKDHPDWLEIKHEHIQARCLDTEIMIPYDREDYDDFLKITFKKQKEE